MINWHPYLLIFTREHRCDAIFYWSKTQFSFPFLTCEIYQEFLLWKPIFNKSSNNRLSLSSPSAFWLRKIIVKTSSAGADRKKTIDWCCPLSLGNVSISANFLFFYCLNFIVEASLFTLKNIIGEEIVSSCRMWCNNLCLKESLKIL